MIFLSSNEFNGSNIDEKGKMINGNLIFISSCVKRKTAAVNHTTVN